MIKLTINEVLEKLPNAIDKNTNKIYVMFNDNAINVNKQRYINFKNRGVTCECCGAKGEYFSLDIDDKRNKTLTLHGTKDGEDVVISSVGKKAVNPKYERGTILCVDCIHKNISHNKSNKNKNRKNEYEKYKESTKESFENNPFKDLLKDFKIEG